MTERTPGIARRSAARLAAVQALYEIDMVGAPATPVLREFLERRWSDASPVDHDDPEVDVDGAVSLPKPEHRFLKRLVTGVTDNVANLDAVIAPQLNSPWVVNQLDTLVRAILRAGSFEFLHCPEIRARTIISEYVGLSHAFFSENEPALVNAVLDGLAGQYRQNEFLDTVAHPP